MPTRLARYIALILFEYEVQISHILRNLDPQNDRLLSATMLKAMTQGKGLAWLFSGASYCSKLTRSGRMIAHLYRRVKPEVSRDGWLEGCNPWPRFPNMQWWSCQTTQMISLWSHISTSCSLTGCFEKIKISGVRLGIQESDLHTAYRSSGGISHRDMIGREFKANTQYDECICINSNLAIKILPLRRHYWTSGMWKMSTLYYHSIDHW